MNILAFKSYGGGFSIQVLDFLGGYIGHLSRRGDGAYKFRAVSNMDGAEFLSSLQLREIADKMDQLAGKE